MMGIPFFEIDALLQRWAHNDPPIRDFTVNNILSAINSRDESYEPVLRYLLSKDGFTLHAKKMLMCPNNHKGRSFLLAEPIAEDEVFECWCGEEYYYEPVAAIVVFEFTEDFVEQAKKKQQLIMYQS